MFHKVLSITSSGCESWDTNMLYGIVTVQLIILCADDITIESNLETELFQKNQQEEWKTFTMLPGECLWTLIYND